jgi:hypothetical protein
MGRACGTYGGGEKCIQVFTGKSKRRRVVERSLGKREDNIKMNVRK